MTTKITDLNVAMNHDLERSPKGAEPALRARVKTIRTRAQARQYLAEVAAKIEAARTTRATR